MENFNPINHAICFTLPLRMAPSAWTEHIPFSMCLLDLLCPTTLVELGTYRGTSYCAFCQVIQTLGLATRCYAVDTWQGDAHSGFYGPEILAELRAYHDPRYSSFSHLLQATFDDALAHFVDGSIDLLHLDGYHTYEAARHDFESWLPKLSERGVMVLHDTDERSSDFGVWKLFEEAKRQYPHFEFFHGHGLGVLAIGQQYPEPLRGLVEAPEKARTAIRAFFFQLGMRLEAEDHAQRELALAHSQLAQQQAHNENISAHAKGLAEHLEVVRHNLSEQLQTVRTLQTELVQTQSDLVQMRTESEQAQIYARGLQTQNQSLQQELAFLQHSRGVHLIKLARTARHLLSTQGPVAATKQTLHWLSGERGYWERRTPPARPLSLSLPSLPQQEREWSILESHLPPAAAFAGVSIVIPIFNALDYAKACVKSIYQANTLPFEVIAVDNGSRPEVLAWLKSEAQERERFFFLSLSRNLGFAKAMNLGMEQARGRYIVIHNSDTVVASEWLNHLVQAAESDPQLGIVSPMTNYCGEGPQIDETAKDLPVEKVQEFAATIRERTNLLPVPARLVFFSVLLKREVFEAIGGLDENFGLGNYEDEEYCIRARLAGFKLAIAPNAFVYHHGSQTFKDNQIDHSLWMNQNLGTYLSKLSQISISLPPRIGRTTSRPWGEVSVVVRTCNRPETLQVALASLANQTLDAFEVVLVNDGGQDVCEIIQQFEQYFPITYVCHTERKGPGAALNAGTLAAKGDWLTYLDDDDIVYPVHLETLWTTLQQAPPHTHFAYSNYCQAVMQGRGFGATTILLKAIPRWEFSARQLQVQNYQPPSTWMHSRACLEEVGGFNESIILVEDWEFLMRVSASYSLYPTMRFSNEYRLYLDGSNITLEQRTKHLEQMERVYTLHPVDEPSLLAWRKELIAQVKLQIVGIEKIKHLAEQKYISPQEANRRIITLITGVHIE